MEQPPQFLDAVRRGRAIIPGKVTSSATIPWLLASVLTLGCPATPFREVTVNFDAGSSLAVAVDAGQKEEALRFSVAALRSPEGTYSAYGRVFQRMGQKMGRKVELIQRRTYREVNDLLLSGQVDAAFVCTGGYVDLERRARGAVEILAAPVVNGRMTYRSLTIVPVGSSAQSLADLAGKRFAFTDPLSFTGYLVVAARVRSMGSQPERFFSRTLFTQGHDRSTKAVAGGLVDGAAVDNHVFDELMRQNPALARQVRVIDVSPEYGIPPVVALTSLSVETRSRIRGALLSLETDGEAVPLLRNLHVERFAVPEKSLYDSARVLAESSP